jgi:O-acetyl-ADP-ribose deacetylase (regulator of RNase III)
MRLTAVHGDITTADVDVTVNAANSSLMGGGGVDGAIHRAAGPELVEATRAIRAKSYPSGLPVGEAVFTPGFRLKARGVIHTVGPDKHRGQTDPGLLAAAFSNSLRIAANGSTRTIAFPAISAGIYGWDPEDVARIAVDAVLDSPWVNTFDEIRFVLFTNELRDIFEEAIAAAVAERAKNPRTPIADERDGDLWGPSPDDPALLPSSPRWEEAERRVADQPFSVSYGGGVVKVNAGDTYWVDSRGWTLVGWHGTYDPPSGMDGQSMINES